MKFSILEVYVQQRRDDNVLTAKVRHVDRCGTIYGVNLLKKKPFVVDRMNDALFAATTVLAGKAEKVRFVFEPFIGKEPVEYTVS